MRGGLPWRYCSERACVRAVLLQAQRAFALRGRPEDDPEDVFACAPQMRVQRDALKLVLRGWLHQCVAPRRQRVERAQEEQGVGSGGD